MNPNDVIECEDAEYCVTFNPQLLLCFKGKELLKHDWFVVSYKNGEKVFCGSRDKCIEYCKKNNLKFSAVGISECG